MVVYTDSVEVTSEVRHRAVCSTCGEENVLAFDMHTHRKTQDVRCPHFNTPTAKATDKHRGIWSFFRKA
jgi:DNA-directed RNA polymerase subunit RPC12/RpoP